MSCLIGVQAGDQVRYVHCKLDGSIYDVGYYLHYGYDPDGAEALISRGDMSCVHDSVERTLYYADMPGKEHNPPRTVSYDEWLTLLDNPETKASFAYCMRPWHPDKPNTRRWHVHQNVQHPAREMGGLDYNAWVRRSSSTNPRPLSTDLVHVPKQG